MILIVNALAVLFLFCGLDLIVEMLSPEKWLSPWLCCAIVAPVKEITRITAIYGRRQQACKDTEYYYNDFSCFLTEGDTRFLHGQLFASPFNMILHCLTFIVFLTTNLSITLYSSVIIFHSFHPSFIFYQADFDFELRQMAKLITMYSVSFISGPTTHEVQQREISRFHFLSKYFGRNPTKGNNRDAFRDGLETWDSICWTERKDEWRDEAAGVRDGGLCNKQREPTLEKTVFPRQIWEYMAL